MARQSETSYTVIAPAVASVWVEDWGEEVEVVKSEVTVQTVRSKESYNLVIGCGSSTTSQTHERRSGVSGSWVVSAVTRGAAVLR